LEGEGEVGKPVVKSFTGAMGNDGFYFVFFAEFE
jgi:hypothetical protein